MCLNQYPQSNQTRDGYGVNLLPNQTHLDSMNMPHKWGTPSHPDIDRVSLSPSLDHRERLQPKRLEAIRCPCGQKPIELMTGSLTPLFRALLRVLIHNPSPELGLG